MVALCVATTVMVNAGKARYMWATVLPLVFIVATTMTAGYQMIFYRFGPGASLAASGRGNLFNALLTGTMLVCVVIILGDSIRVWICGRRAQPPEGAVLARAGAMTEIIALDS